MNELLTTKELAERWNLQPITLKKWREKGKGPRYLKIGSATSKVFYRLKDVQEFEEKHLVEPVV